MGLPDAMSALSRDTQVKYSVIKPKVDALKKQADKLFSEGKYSEAIKLYKKMDGLAEIVDGAGARKAQTQRYNKIAGTSDGMERLGAKPVKGEIKKLQELQSDVFVRSESAVDPKEKEMLKKQYLKTLQQIGVLTFYIEANANGLNGGLPVKRDINGDFEYELPEPVFLVPEAKGAAEEIKKAVENAFTNSFK